MFLSAHPHEVSKTPKELDTQAINTAPTAMLPALRHLQKRTRFLPWPELASSTSKEPSLAQSYHQSTPGSYLSSGHLSYRR